MKKKWLVIGFIVLLLIVLMAWLFIESAKPPPGEKALQDGRNHMQEGSKVDYKFNPPTSGNHYASWITKGFYDTPRIDGNLVHSLEHGYIIIWYNCENKMSQDVILRQLAAGSLANVRLKQVDRFFFSFRMTEVYAQSTPMTQGSEGSPSASLESMPKSFSDGSCDNLKNRLKGIYSKLGPHKLIVIPRVGMDHPIVLTAWGRMEKLDSVDQSKIKEFIDAFRDAGPEQTVEP